MGMIIGRSLTPLNSSRTLRAVRRREMVRCSDDNSRRKVQNVRGGSSAICFIVYWDRTLASVSRTCLLRQREDVHGVAAAGRVRLVGHAHGDGPAPAAPGRA